MSSIVFLKSNAPQPSAPQPQRLPSDYKLHRRFDRMGRLVGDAAMARLADSHVIVMGCGGVGSFAAESLVRSGVGTVSIVDFDLICATNSNRQLHTLQGTAGKPKVEVMAERLALINPKCRVIARREFYNAESSDALLEPTDAPPPDIVIDAIDNVTAKCHLIATCHDRGIPLVVSMGAAARMDPTQIALADLNRTSMDRLAKAVRKILRTRYGFPSRSLTGIVAVYSTEPAGLPHDLVYDRGQGFRCVCPQGKNGLHECEHRNRIDGSAGFVTGAFGLAACSAAVRMLCGETAHNLLS